MPEIVQLLMKAEHPPLNWPECCPKCGSEQDLVKTTSRLGRIKSVSMPLTGGVSMKNQVLYLTFPTCKKHGKQTHLANILIEKSGLMQLLRIIVYFGACFSLAFLLDPTAFISQYGLFSLFPVLGLLGGGAIIWASLVTCVWPLRILPEQQLFEIRFLSCQYAAEFRFINRKATDERLMPALPWYKHSLPIAKVLFILCLLVNLLVLFNRFIPL